MRLSDHFYLHEMTRLQLATRHQIVNQPNATQIDALRHFGVPIVPSSGFRCLTLNRLLGSQDTSKHCLGEAVDFEIIGVSNICLAHWMAQNLVFDQLILEYPQVDDGRAGWVHVSCRGAGNRGQCLTRRQNGYIGGLPKLKRVHEKFPTAQKT
ncbi:MAG: D-Ala-D-Ala carboxypeptidase family metallohydrolase [Parvibaculales bacterium]